MEKRANNSHHKMSYKFLFVGLFVFFGGYMQAQTENYTKGRTYVLDSILVSGLETYNAQTVISYSGLRKGQELAVPGEEISGLINKLWGLELFSDINLYVTKVVGKKITIEIEIEELPTLSEVKIKGIKKGRIESILSDTELTVGKKLSESFLTNTKNFIQNKYKKEGFLNTKVVLNTIKDTVEGNAYKMVVNIDKGPRVKIQDIVFDGNEIFNDKKLQSKFKNTKHKKSIRFWKKSKFIEKDFKEDLGKLVDFYKEEGYRDARVLSDSIIQSEDGSNAINLNLAVEEGNKYYFGDIKFIGNTVYSNSVLEQILGLKKGDVYNGVLQKTYC